MKITKNDPKVSRCFGSTELIIAWQGRQFWNQTFEDEPKVDVEEIRQLLDDNSAPEAGVGKLR